MYKTSLEGAAFVRALARELGPGLRGRDVVVAPAFTGLREAVHAAEGTGIAVCAQDVFWEAEGAYTGEVSATMLADLGVTTVIIGHSERRALFGETDESVAKKVRAALDHGLQAIMCVGESEGQRDEGQTESVLSRQVPAGLAMAREAEMANVAIAYEPIWAIGTGRTATPVMAEEAVAFVRTQVEVSLGARGAEIVRVLYGGSVRPDNIDDLMAQPDIDGVLVGGASLDVAAFARIVRFVGA
ncbi:MAG: triose-phosphate isomerase [Actinobacteria bacterium]|nr:triose-phosphate isomerase [Actinomycetota bacterium]